MSTVQAAPAPTEGGSPVGSVLPDSIFFDDPWWPLQVLELALRGIMAEAKDNRLDNDDVSRMTEPLFALAYEARRAAAAREDGR
jgi:hypothetical protein